MNDKNEKAPLALAGAREAVSGLESTDAPIIQPENTAEYRAISRLAEKAQHIAQRAAAEEFERMAATVARRADEMDMRLLCAAFARWAADEDGEQPGRLLAHVARVFGLNDMPAGVDN